MKKPVVGIQLYTLRDFIQTAPDFDATLARLEGWGVTDVQISAIGDIPADVQRDVLRKHGMRVCVTHKSLDRMRGDLQGLIEEHKTINCDALGLGSAPGEFRGSAEKVRKVADCAKMHHVPIRIGVNAGSLEKDILAKYGGLTPQGMVDSALRHVKLLEEVDFDDIVISLKASDVPTTVQAYRLMHKVCDYPLHLGVAEAGLPGQGTVKSAIGIGSLLLDGIGDTVRVSLTSDPVDEPRAALEILRALGLRKGIRFVSCPTCGRTQINVMDIAQRVTREFADIDLPVTVAVMGCVVNGPGEARDADIALCGGKDCGELFIHGKPVKKLTGDLADGFVQAVREYLRLSATDA